MRVECILNMNKEIIRALEDLLKPINKKLITITTINNNLSMGLRQEIAHVDSKVDQVASELNDIQQYLRRYDLRIFNVPVAEIANKEVFDWVFEYCNHQVGVNIDKKDSDRAHRIGKEKGGKVQIIVRFCSWQPRCMVFRNRRSGTYPIRVDLTKSNVAFFNDVKDLLPQYSTMAKYGFIDINCKIRVKLQHDNLFFSTVSSGAEKQARTIKKY